MKPTSTSITLSKISAYFILLLFMLYIALIYSSGFFEDWQELVTEPFFLLKGLHNYTDIATHHAPLLTEFLAVIYSFFGTDKIIRILLLLLISIVTALLTYRASCRLAGRRAGRYAIILLAMLWPYYGGTNFWFDTFLPIFYLIAFVILIEKYSSRWIYLAGISMGLSFLIKQHGGVVALGMLFMLLVRTKNMRVRLKEGLAFSGGVLTPIAIMILWYASTGQLRDAIYWIIEYNLSKHYVALGKQQPPTSEIIRLIVISAPIIIFLVGAVFFKRERQLLSWNLLFTLIAGFCSSFTIFPRWERWHVIPSIPFLVISLVLSFKLLLTATDKFKKTGTKKIIRIILACWIAGIFLDLGRPYAPALLEKVVPKFSRLWPQHSDDPPAWYDESFRRYLRDMPSIGKYLKKETSEDDKIFVWGWLGSKIYFEADRLPAGKFYYALPWFTCLPQFKSDLLKGFTENRPRFVIIAKKPFLGTPALSMFGINLGERGYIKMSELEGKYPEVIIWKSNLP